MSYQRTEFCYCHYALCTEPIQIRPAEQRPVLLAHTLCSVLRSTEKKQGRGACCARERGRINKGKYNPEAWFTLSRMRRALSPCVPFSLTSPIYLASSFLSFFFPRFLHSPLLAPALLLLFWAPWVYGHAIATDFGEPSPVVERFNRPCGVLGWILAKATTDRSLSRFRNCSKSRKY